MSKEIATVKKTETIKDLLINPAIQNQIKMALPKHITPDRLCRTALTVLNSNEKLMSCTKQSLMSCILQSAQLGLEPGPFGLVYFVPYGDKAQFIPGYKGLIELARRSGLVKSIYSCLVFEKEPFNIELGLNRDLKHQALSPDKRGEELIGTYAVIHYNDGGYDFEFMWISEVDKIRNRSKAANSGPWVTDYEEMVKKTVLKRLLKRQSLSPEIRDATVLDDKHEAGEAQLFDLPEEVRDQIKDTEEKSWKISDIRKIMAEDSELEELVAKSKSDPKELQEMFKVCNGDMDAVKAVLVNRIAEVAKNVTNQS